MPNDQHMMYTGQLKQQTNDTYFEDERTVFIVVSKSLQNRRQWSFLGAGQVLSRIAERVKHPINPSPPRWILQYTSSDEAVGGVDIPALNHALRNRIPDQTCSSVKKEDVMSVLEMGMKLIPCKENYRSVGIVPMKGKG